MRIVILLSLQLESNSDRKLLFAKHTEREKSNIYSISWIWFHN